jgi:hypothetical protein
VRERKREDDVNRIREDSVKTGEELVKTEVMLNG